MLAPDLLCDSFIDNLLLNCKLYPGHGSVESGFSACFIRTEMQRRTLCGRLKLLVIFLVTKRLKVFCYWLKSVYCGVKLL